jgi:hypothetical protein
MNQPRGRHVNRRVIGAVAVTSVLALMLWSGHPGQPSRTDVGPAVAAPAAQQSVVFLPVALPNVTDLAPVHGLCEGAAPRGHSFTDGPFGVGVRDLAADFTLPTTAGDWNFRDRWTGCDDYVFLLYQRNSSNAQAMWQSDLKRLFETSPANTHWFFLSYSKTEAEVLEDVGGLQTRIDAYLATLSADEQQKWAGHFHYVTQSALALPSWLPAMFMAWGGTVPGVTATWQQNGASQTVSPEAFGARGDWLPPLTQAVEAPLAWYGQACNAADGQPSEPVQDVTGKIALIERGTCAFWEKVWNAEKKGAKAALIYTNTNPKAPMGCSAPSDCNSHPTITGSIIDNAPGVQLRDLLLAGTSIYASLAPTAVGVDAFGIDRYQRLREFGLNYFPYMDTGIGFNHPAMEAGYYNWEWQSQERLAGRADRVIPIFQHEDASDPGWSGKRSVADVTLPDAAEMATYDTAELELSMSCPDHRDRNCPPWDYLVYLYLCDAGNPDKCDFELGRWVTTYAREGHWVTDISPFLGQLRSGGPRRFGFWTVQRYFLDLNLRLSNQRKNAAAQEIIPLFTGGDFNADYNKKYQPLTIQIPADVKQVQLVAVISGHGGGTDMDNCAEFCNHTHDFKVNGVDFIKGYPEAGTDFGCANQVGTGVPPNQYGTWMYGRGGWCPGLEVEPWVKDVTAAVNIGGANVIEYRAGLDGKDYIPKPVDPPVGYNMRIDMQSYLVLLR